MGKANSHLKIMKYFIAINLTKLNLSKLILHHWSLGYNLVPSGFQEQVQRQTKEQEHERLERQQLQEEQQQIFRQQQLQKQQQSLEIRQMNAMRFDSIKKNWRLWFK